jgi:hypothetical protein
MNWITPNSDFATSVVDNNGNPIPVLKGLDPIVYDDKSGQISILTATASHAGALSAFNQSIVGIKNFTSGISLGVAPSLTATGLSSDVGLGLSNSLIPTQGAVKGYVDNRLYIGLSWQQAVKDTSAIGPIGGAVSGDRLISTASAGGWIKDYIYTYTSVWTGLAPAEGMCIWVESLDSAWVYSNSVWEHLGVSIDHNDLIGKGTNAHSVIDSHLGNTTNAHFGQALGSTASPTFAGLSLIGNGSSTIVSQGAGILSITQGVLATDKINFLGTLDASAPTTAGIQMGGGLGIAKALWVGGLANIAGVLTLSGTSSSHVISSTTDSTAIGNGSIRTAGGMGITKALWVGGLANIAGVLTLSGTSSSHVISSTTDSTTISTGSIRTAGGMGITKALWVGGLANIAGVLTLSGSVTHTVTGNETFSGTSSLLTLTGTGASITLPNNTGTAINVATGNITASTFTSGGTGAVAYQYRESSLTGTFLGPYTGVGYIGWGPSVGGVIYLSRIGRLVTLTFPWSAYQCLAGVTSIATFSVALSAPYIPLYEQNFPVLGSETTTWKRIRINTSGNIIYYSDGSGAAFASGTIIYWPGISVQYIGA